MSEAPGRPKQARTAGEAGGLLVGEAPGRPKQARTAGEAGGILVSFEQPAPIVTRFALFEGRVHDGMTAAFRAAVLAEVLPHWTAFPGVLAVRVCFADERDEGAPELPLILAISYADRAAVDAALASAARAAAKAATEAILARYFEGRIHHHITQAHDHVIAGAGAAAAAS
jgi:hypothetical protein